MGGQLNGESTRDRDKPIPLFALRQASHKDYDFLFDLHRAAMREYIEAIWGWHEDWQAEYFQKKFDPANRKIIVIDGEDAGVVVVEQRPEALYLGLIELLPEFQGRGTGSVIVEQLKSEAFRKGQPLALHVLATNLPALRLYERLGFKIERQESIRYYMVCSPGASAPNSDNEEY